MPPKKVKSNKNVKRNLKSTVSKKVAKASKAEEFDEDAVSLLNKIPRTMVFRRGAVGDSVKRLVQDLRHVMAPYTALRLKERRNNQLADFLKVASPLNVTHFLMLSQTALATHLRIARLPRGPTVTLRVLSYSTMQALRAVQKNPHGIGNEYNSPPLVVLNNFNPDDDNMKITAALLQNMFPGIDLQSVKLAQCRRCVLFNYDAETDTIEFRHYLIQAMPVGLTKGVRKVIKGKLPDLHDREDIADYIDNPNTMSDSEAEFGDDVRVTLAQEVHGRGNVQKGTSALKLKELGPRMTLELYKIEDGFCEGHVIYNRYVNKTPEELEELEGRKQQEASLKEQRRKQQEENILRKQQQKLEARQKQIEAIRAKQAAAQNEMSDEIDPKNTYDMNDLVYEDDSDEQEDDDMLFDGEGEEGDLFDMFDGEGEMFGGIEEDMDISDYSDDSD